MSLPNGSAGNAPASARHARQNTRIVPVIPKRYSRQSVDKTSAKQGAKQAQSESSTPPSTSNTQTTRGDETTQRIGQSNGTADVKNGGNVAVEVGGDIKGDSGEANQTAADADTPTDSGSIPAVPQEQSGDTTTSASSVEPSSDVSAQQEQPVAIPQHQSTTQAPTRTSVRSPVELPPPFYPASQVNGNGYPQAKDAERSSNRQSFVFGGHVDSSAPSPIPPPSAGSWHSSSGPGRFADGSFSPPVPLNGFTHPPPAPNGVSYSPVTPQDSSVSTGRPPFVTNGHGSHTSRHLNRERYAQSPRSGSVGSNMAEPPFQPQYAAYPPGPVLPVYPPGNDTPVAPQRAMPFSPFTPSFTPTRTQQFDSRYHDQDMNNAIALRSHTESLFASSDFADVLFEMPSSFNGPSQLFAHSFILARSPRLRSILLEASSSHDRQEGKPYRTLHVPESAIFRDGGLFPLAVRSLYGGGFVRREHLPGNLKSPKQVMEWVLSYATAGWWLQVPEIATAGLSLASELLIIDNIEVALGFALAESKEQVKSNGTNGNRHTTDVSEPPSPKYAPFAVEFLFAVLRFITWPLVNNFEFDSSTPELETLRRVPDQLKRPAGTFHASRPSASNPKLQGIQLGDFQLHSSVNRTLSSILLSVPTFVLQALFNERAVLERLPPDTRVGLLRAVVGERERRRTAAAAVLERLSPDEIQDEVIQAKLSVLATAEKVEASSADANMMSLITEVSEAPALRSEM
ncbi:hypothetical protein KVT40_001046 [Elsinoe batatas]|uniref:BTB domain-containing protein n=1 Tax=Elsinoe batatas TaxID=2601811 RepID=A0A8K0PJ79_9PEZI|nr:hypothetical protein KVT40_001046 [Elsinoe batatas]